MTFVQLQKARTRMFGFPVEAKMHSFDNAADSGGFVIWNSMNKKSNCSAEQCWRIFTMLAKVVGTIRNQLTADCAFFVQYPINIKIKTFDTRILKEFKKFPPTYYQLLPKVNSYILTKFTLHSQVLKFIFLLIRISRLRIFSTMMVVIFFKFLWFLMFSNPNILSFRNNPNYFMLVYEIITKEKLPFETGYFSHF